MRPLTQKQQLFYKYYYTHGSESFGNGPKSAKRAGYKGNDNTLRQRAHELVTNSNASKEKARIQAETGADVGYTVKNYQDELESVRARAQSLRQPSAEVSAIVAKGRSMGYDKDNDAGSKDQAKPLTEEDMAVLRDISKQLTDRDLAQGPRLAQNGQTKEGAG